MARAGRSGTRVTRCKYRPGAPCILGRGDRCRTAFSAVPWRHGAQTGGHPDGVSPLIAVSIVPAVDIRDRVTERLGASMAGGKTPARNYPKIGYRHGWCCCGRSSGSEAWRDRRGHVADRGFSVAPEAILPGRDHRRGGAIRLSRARLPEGWRRGAHSPRKPRGGAHGPWGNLV